MADYEYLDQSISRRILRFLTSNATWILGALALIFLITTISLAAVGPKEKIVDNTIYVTPTDSPVTPTTSTLSPTGPTMIVSIVTLKTTLVKMHVKPVVVASIM